MNSTTGRVIGKGGRRINTITDVSGAQITVSKATGKNSDRTVTIRGLPKSVTKAQNMISAALQSNVSNFRFFFFVYFFFLPDEEGRMVHRDTFGVIFLPVLILRSILDSR